MIFKFQEKKYQFFIACIILFGYSCQSNGHQEQVIHIEADELSKVFTTKDFTMKLNNGFPIDSLIGKTISITGIVDDITFDKFRVLLKDTGDNHGVVCVLKDTIIANNLQKGNRILFKGVFIGQLGSYMHLKDCVIIRGTSN